MTRNKIYLYSLLFLLPHVLRHVTFLTATSSRHRRFLSRLIKNRWIRRNEGEGGLSSDPDELSNSEKLLNIASDMRQRHRYPSDDDASRLVFDKEPTTVVYKKRRVGSLPSQFSSGSRF